MFKKTEIQKRAIKLFNSLAREFLLLGGSRSGKSFIIVYAIIVIACIFPNSRHLIARKHFNQVKNSIWNDTLKKVLKVCFPNLAVAWNNVDYFITLPNGSEVWIAGLDDKDRLEKILGREYLTIFLNEASQLSYDAYTTVKTRLAQRIEGAKRIIFIDENPPSKKHWTYKVFIEKKEPEGNTPLQPERYAALKINPDQNLENIGDDYLQILDSLPKSKRTRFRDGEFSDDSAFALWTDRNIASARVDVKPVLKRIVVAIDPAVTSKDTSDETGIVVAGVSMDDQLYVLEDLSGTYTPTEWAKIGVNAYRNWRADRIVGEVNNGGDLIETVIKTVDKNVSYKGVHATRDKLTRAEPVAALYEQGKGRHVGEHAELELEMTTWEGKKGEPSPNRIDALVWAAAELLPLMTSSNSNINNWASAFG